jgi:ribosomal protein L23
MWTFRSKSGTIWKHKFVVEDIKICNISPKKARHFRGWTKEEQRWQTQIMLKRGEGYEEFYSFITSLKDT